MTAGALLVNGYHPYAEDAEIYLPGVERILNPNLFPLGREFFAAHASLTLFPNLVALSIRITHLPFESGLLLWHVASIFLLLLACWELSGVCFSSARAQWGSACMVAALLTIPVAGTALYILDQYLNPRNLAAFAAIFAVCVFFLRTAAGDEVWDEVCRQPTRRVADRGERSRMPAAAVRNFPGPSGFAGLPSSRAAAWVSLHPALGMV
jgi:hypothetical protein